jgi:threonine dehydratase
MQGLVDDVLLVKDAHIVEAMKLVFQHTGFMLEPAGAAGVAAIVAHPMHFAGKCVATVLCGSNVTASQFAAYVS